MITGQREHGRRKPEAVAHRGASGYAPGNTLKAFRMALAMGAPFIELDVQLSRSYAIRRMIALGVDRIISNYPGRVMRQLVE